MGRIYVPDDKLEVACVVEEMVNKDDTTKEDQRERFDVWVWEALLR